MRYGERVQALRTSAVLMTGQRRPGNFVVPKKDKKEIFRHQLSFQPASLVSWKNEILIADYFHPAFRKGTVKETVKGIEFSFEVINRAENAPCGLFPDVLMPLAANRCMTVNFDFYGKLWITRGVDAKIFTLAPKLSHYRLAEGVMQLNPDRMIQSLLIWPNRNFISTIECTLDCRQWFECLYSIGDFAAIKADERPSPAFLYLLQGPKDDSEAWYITDARAEIDHGIYRGEERKMVLEDVTGISGTFLTDRSCLISYYGYEQGEPGEIIRVPASHFKR